MEIGRKVYYSKDSGVVIWDKGEMSGDVIETTVEQDCVSMPVLTLINPDMLGVVQFEFSAYAEDFKSCKGFIIDPVTQTPVFVS